MKQNSRKNQKVTKGMPSAVVLSILIHAALFLLAGMLVVFTVVKKEEKKFVPPKAVERPKMKLKKPKVKVKKTSKPKPTTRIVTKVNRANMPDMQLPEMSGMGEGLGGGIGGFDMMPDLGDVTIFGSGQSIGNDFVGTFYDFKRDRSGRSIPMDPYSYLAVVTKFVRGGWKTSQLARYYQSPKKLYATSFMVPWLRSSVAPVAFGEYDTGGWCWAAHYKGLLVYPEDLTFRFWGNGDDLLMVRVDGEMVLAANWYGSDRWPMGNVANSWQSDSADSAKYFLGNNVARVGDWITLEAGVPLDMEVLLGEVPGGGFCSMLTVEVKGVEYEHNRQNGPILPMFKTSEPSHDLLDQIYEWLVEGEASLTNGPVFRDYTLRSRGDQEVAAIEEPSEVLEEKMAPDDSGIRIWRNLKGKEFEAEFISVIGDKVVLKSAKGKQKKIPLVHLSPEDLAYIDLANPPDLDITFTKQSSQASSPPTSPFLVEHPTKLIEYTFGTKIRQTSSGTYNHELRVEFFSIGQQYLDDHKFYLLDRQSSTFVPTQENKRSHRFYGEPVGLVSYNLGLELRGKKYSDYLVVVTDERGEIIQHSASSNWLFRNFENLKEIPVGVYLDKTCTRVFPTGPVPIHY